MRICKPIRMIILLLFLLVVSSFSVGATETELESEPETETQSTETVEPDRMEVRNVSGKYFLYNQTTGKRYKGPSGIQEVPAGSGNYYYFRNQNGRIYASGWFSKDKKYYYAGPDGLLKSGWTEISQKNYYFNPKTFTRSTGWKKIKKIYYYFNTKGAQVTGWMRLNKYTYYLDPAENGAKTIGWKKISKKNYYFNSRGRLQTGMLTIDGKKYYCDKDGVRKTGLLTINGKKYFFDKKTGVMKTGWLTVSGKKYYFSAVSSRYGQAVTGWMKKGGYYYYFNSNAVMQKGWLTLNNKKYYLNPNNGRMTTGKATIDGKTYDFGTKGYINIEPTGAWSIRVNRVTNVVTIYRGTTPVKALLCSVGLNGATPTGTRYIADKLRWHELMGPCWGQYCSHLGTTRYETWSDYLFHSILYNRPGDPYSLSPSSYNALGQAASHGCIRLTVGGAKYIYDNCPIGTPVTIFDGTSANDPLGKPKLNPSWIPPTQYWDPTDPNI